MSHSLLESVLSVLKQDTRLVSEDGDLLKNKAQELAYKLDPTIIGLLLKDSLTKAKFFREIEECLIFNQDAFVSFVMSKEFLPDSYTSYKNKIGLTIDGKGLDERKEVSLVWAYKDCVLAGGQDKEDSKRDEIFYNETLGSDQIDRLLDPKIFTEFKRVDKDGKHFLEAFRKNENGDIKDNLVIKGNNLLALHSLKKRFKGKVKLIYIDPPYNTGTDSFKYNDRFNHSTWLTFMKNRLEVAKELLREDGVIFVQCDDSEQAYLKVLLDGIFGKDNQLSTFFIQVRYPDKQLAKAMTFHKLVESIHVYAKSEQYKLYQTEEEYSFDKFTFECVEKSKPSKTIELGGYKVDVFNSGDFEIIDHKESNDVYLKEIWASGKILDSSSTGRFFRDFLDGRAVSEDGLGVLYKVYDMGDGSIGYRYITGPQKIGATRGKYYQEIPKGRLDGSSQSTIKPIENYYDMAGYFGNCRQEGGVGLRGGKKPEKLLHTILESATNENDLVLDFFGGSGTTGAVAHKMKRQYILTEQMDYIHDLPEQRLINVINGDKTGISESVGWHGGGDFVYMEIACNAERYIEMIRDAENTDILLEIWTELKTKSFVNHKLNPKNIDNTLAEFKALSLAEQQKILIDLIDKNALYKNLSEMNDEKSEVSEEDKKLNRDFYNL